MRLMSPLSERFDGISGNGNDFIGWNHLRLEISGREMRYSWYGNCQCSCRLWRLLSRRGGRTAGWAAWAAAGHRRSPPLPVRPRPSPMEAAGGCRSSWAASGPFGPAWTEAGRRGLLSTGSWCHVPISLVRFLFHLISPPSSLSSSRAPSSSSTLGFYKILRSYDYRIGGGFFSNFLPLVSFFSSSDSIRPD